MNREQNDLGQPHRPFPPYRIVPSAAAIREEIAPCSRFKSTLSYRRRLALRLSLLLRDIDGVQNSYVTLHDTPPNWRHLLSYLYRNRVIAEPYFFFPSQRNDLPKVASVRLRAAGSSDTDAQDVLYAGFSSTNDIQESLSRVVGEVLERHFLRQYQRDSLVRTSQRLILESGARCLDIFSLNGYSDEQRARFKRYERSAESPIYWVRGKEILSGVEAYIPAQLAFWSYDFDRDVEEPILGDSTTNGAAGHFTREEALLGALLENIQRDGFLLYWLLRAAPPRIRPESAPEATRTLIEYFHRYHLDVHFMDITSDLNIPSLACVLVDRKGSHIGVGAASGFDYNEMARQSAGEALAVLSGQPEVSGMPLDEKYEPFLTPGIGRNVRMKMWHGEAWVERLDFFIQGKDRDVEEFMAPTAHISPHVQERLSHVLDECRRLGEGYEVYCFEARSPVLKDVGYNVVKCIVPRLINLYLREHRATIAAPRLREAASRLGVEGTSLNPWPHPFP